MIQFLKYSLLWPFSIVYGFITFVRNKLYDSGFFSSFSAQIPTISVGNLAVGGTGKTPFVELLISLLQNHYNVAVLSRGYKRKTKGFVLASVNSTSMEIGDESYQIFRKFKNLIVAVSKKRKTGLLQLSTIKPNVDVVLLDDAYQHRAVKPGLNILLTPYNSLYTDDCMLPAGKLREFDSGSKRADIIVVTKCPQYISDDEILKVTSKLKPAAHQQLYFSCIEYGNLMPVFPEAQKTIDITAKNVLLVTGIVSNSALIDELKKSASQVQTLSFSDHYQFLLKDYAEIEQKFINLHNDDSLIVTTEKDAARMYCAIDFPENLKKSTYYLPITFKILENKQSQLEAQIRHYVTKNKRNS
jgi:tetraacyldisaccharide 4'-kinase